jgi:hypothetical protein
LNQPTPSNFWFNTLTWVCIYGGLLCIVFSLALSESDAELAVGLASAGSLATALGVLMIYIRSRKK